MTVTPPVTVAPIRRAKPALGSKKPLPAVEVPVIVTFVEGCPAGTVAGLADDGAAGGGASSFTTRTP